MRKTAAISPPDPDRQLRKADYIRVIVGTSTHTAITVVFCDLRDWLAGKWSLRRRWLRERHPGSPGTTVKIVVGATNCACPVVHGECTQRAAIALSRRVRATRMRPTVSRSLTPWRVSGRVPPPDVLASGHNRVVARAEFEEREYETACTVELSSSAYGFGPQLWSAGTVFEKILGYDVAVGVSSSNALWQLLGVPRPNGVQLLPKVWAPGPRPPVQRLPAHPVSMILQYKRPEYMHGPRAAQWARWHRPYFRISRSSYQHRVLRQLEARVGPDVVVRYAAPAFHTYAALDLARFAGQVLTDPDLCRPAPSVVTRCGLISFQGP